MLPGLVPLSLKSGLERRCHGRFGYLLDAFPDAKTPLTEQIQWVSDRCLTSTCLLVLCSGNHDAEPSVEGPEPGEPDAGWLVKLRPRGAVLVDGDDIVMHGIRFVSRPWLGGTLPRPGTVPVMLASHDGPAGSEVVGPDLGASGDPEVADIASSLSAQLGSFRARPSTVSVAWSGR